MRCVNIVVAILMSFLIQSCGTTSSGNINKQDDCKAPGLDWMEGVEGYDKKEVFDLATKFEAAAKANAEKVTVLKDASSEVSLASSLQEIVNNTTGRKVKVSQEFFQKAHSYRTTVCNIERWLKDGTFSDPELRKMAQRELITLSSGFNVIATDLQAKIESLEQKIKSRSIPTEKAVQFKNILSEIKNDTIKINSLMSDQESFSFATDLKWLFRSAGWTVDWSQGMYNNPIIGVIVTIKSEANVNKGNLIIKAFESAGIEVKGEINPQNKFDVELVIGAKPQ